MVRPGVRFIPRVAPARKGLPAIKAPPWRGEPRATRLAGQSTTESLYGYKAIEPLSKDDARFVDEIVSERKLLTVDGKWVCSCGGYPMGTVGSVKEDEVTKVVTVFAVHILQRSRALCCRR